MGGGRDGSGWEWVEYLVPFPGANRVPYILSGSCSPHPVTFHCLELAVCMRRPHAAPGVGPWSPLQQAVSQGRVADAHSA